jgi:hypothetical protein
VNGAPTIPAQTFTGAEDTALSGQVAATDAGDTLTFAVVVNPVGGTLTSFTAAGAFSYTPNANFNGADTFQVRVTDTATQTATATITLNLAAANDAPTATDDVFTLTSADALAVLANDADLDGDSLTVTITSAPFAGTATVNADKSVKVQLPAGFKGFTRFGYRITDAGGVTADATALAFIGIPPFKVVTLNPPSPGSSLSGIFVDDLMTRRLAHEETVSYSQIDINGMVAAANGSALAYRYNGGGGQEIRYVDLDHIGQSRQVHPPLTGNESFGAVGISGNGRYVIYELLSGAPNNQKQLNIFDRDVAGAGTRLSLPADQQPAADMGSFSAGGTMMIYPGRSATSQPWLSALYRADFATRTVTRISPEIAGRHAFVWTTPDASRVVDVRFKAGGGMGAYVNGLSPVVAEALLHEPLTNPNVYFPLQMSPDGNWFLFSEQDSLFTPTRMAFSRTDNPGSSTTIGPPGFTYADGYGYKSWRADSQAKLLGRLDGGVYTLFEVPVATPAVMIPVIAASFPVSFDNAMYSDDGERIVYQTNDHTVPSSALAATRRGAFGQTTVLTPTSSLVGPFMLDPSGCVALVSLAGTPATFALVNVDAPLALLTLGPSLNQFATMIVVAR